MGLRTRHEAVAGIRVVSLSGDLDLGTVPVLVDSLTKAVVATESVIAIDLDGAGVPDENVLGLLVGAVARAADSRRRMVFVSNEVTTIERLGRHSLPVVASLAEIEP